MVNVFVNGILNENKNVYKYENVNVNCDFYDYGDLLTGERWFNNSAVAQIPQQGIFDLFGYLFNMCAPLFSGLLTGLFAGISATICTNI